VEKGTRQVAQAKDLLAKVMAEKPMGTAWTMLSLCLWMQSECARGGRTAIRILSTCSVSFPFQPRNRSGRLNPTHKPPGKRDEDGAKQCRQTESKADLRTHPRLNCFPNSTFRGQVSIAHREG